MNEIIKWQVKAVEYLSDYKLKLTFADGCVKIADLENRLNKGILKQLQDINLFKTVNLEFSSIAWDNDADIAPEWLYDNGVDVSNQTGNSPTTGTHD